MPLSHGSHLAKRKEEPVPTLKALTRLLTYIFSAAIDIPEFQRQIASPNVSKFSLALTIVAEDHPSRELRVSRYESFLPVAHALSAASR